MDMRKHTDDSVDAAIYAWRNTMRLGTREAIHHAIRHLDATVRTSGAVSFTEDPVHGREGMYVLKVWSYSMCLAEVYWAFHPVQVVAGQVKREPIAVVVHTERRSVTTSKHQTWTFGSINMHWPHALIVEGTDDDAQNTVAIDKAQHLGWGGIDAATLERTKNYGERVRR
jgi:hypothetical protein